LRIVIDTNILFSYFWKESIIKMIIELNIFELYAPEFAFTELNNHKSEIISKTKATEKEYNQLIKELEQKINIVEPTKYSIELKQITSLPDINDIEFIALAISLDKILWTNDSALKNQDYVIILDTKQIFDAIIKLNKQIDDKNEM
jgi:predicted nucleic acid-binding protein